MSMASIRAKSIPYSYFSAAIAAVYCEFGALIRRVSQRGFGFQVFVEGELTPFAAVATALVSAERRVHVEGVVDRHRAGADPSGHLTRLVKIGGRNVARQAVFGVVADLHRLIEIVVTEDAQHRTEDLFTRDCHVIGHMREDRGLDVIARVQAVGPTRAADDDGGALVDALLDESLDLVELCLGRDRADRGL